MVQINVRVLSMWYKFKVRHRSHITAICQDTTFLMGLLLHSDTLTRELAHLTARGEPGYLLGDHRLHKLDPFSWRNIRVCKGRPSIFQGICTQRPKQSPATSNWEDLGLVQIFFKPRAIPIDCEHLADVI